MHRGPIHLPREVGSCTPLRPLKPMTRHATVYSEPARMRRKNATHVMAKGS